MSNFKNIRGQLARWLEELSHYMIIQHKSGIKHQNADSIPSCNDYRPNVALISLPCGGCPFCTRARIQCEPFEDDVGYIVPISIKSITVYSISPYLDQSSESTSVLGRKNNLKLAQEHDSDIKQIVLWLKNNYEPSSQEPQLSNKTARYFWLCKSELQIYNGILYYLWEDPITSKVLDVVPQCLQQQVLVLCHNIPLSGHLDQANTFEKLRKYASWYHMRSDCT